MSQSLALLVMLSPIAALVGCGGAWSSDPAPGTTTGMAPPAAEAALDEALVAIEAQGPSAQGDLDAAMARLRSAPAALRAIHRALRETPGETPGPRRWKLVYLLSDFGDVTSVDLLKEVAATPSVAPAAVETADPSGAEGDHQPSAQGEQAMVRRQAIWALEKIASRGSGAAAAGLEELLGGSDRETRMSAALALHRLGRRPTQLARRGNSTPKQRSELGGEIRVRSRRVLVQGVAPAAEALERARHKEQLAASAQPVLPRPPINATTPTRVRPGMTSGGRR